MSKPQLGLTVNGTTITNALLSADIENNNFFAADTFEAEIALNAMPAAFNAAFWSNSQAQIGISVGVGSGLTQLILGNADDVDIEIPAGLLRVRGRDLSAPLMDNKTTEKFQNQTSSQIVTQIAQMPQFNLTPNVAATTAPSGVFYEIDHARLTDNISYWTLLNELARFEGFDVYVSGSTLNFQPSVPAGQPSYTINYTPPTPQMIQSGNFIDLKMHKSQTLAKDVVVQVTSWNSKQRTAFTAASPPGAKASTNGNSTFYPMVRAGLTMDQAQQLAQNMRQEIALHERVVEVNMPGELALRPRQHVALTGTGTSFDQTYYIDRINRRVDVDGGFSESIRMKNQSPQNTADA